MERSIEHPSTQHMHVREACFIVQASLVQLHDFAAQQHVHEEQLSHLLAEAVDEDNYRQDVWVGHLAGHNLRFHLARLRVELRDITPTTYLR